MLNLSDKELDRLSREAADLYEPDESSLSWSRLEQKLTEQMPERPPDVFRFRRISPYMWGPAVAILAGASFYLIKNNFYSQHSTRTNQSITRKSPASPAEINSGSENTVRLDSLSAVTGNGVSAGGQAQTDETDKTKATPVSGQSLPSATDDKTVSGAGTDNPVSDYAEVESLNTNGTKATNNSGKKVSRSKNTVPVSGITTGSLLYGETLTKNQSDAGSNASGNQTNASGKKNQISLPGIVSAAGTPVNVKGNNAMLNKFSLSTSPKPEKSLRVNRSLNIGLAFGPDYTNAGGITNNQFGNNIGMTIGYYLTPELSVNTGFLYSNKFYWSEGRGYNQPQYAPVGNVRTYAASPPVELVNGSCNMWEIPLTVRFDFARDKKTKFFANAGVSSYFMMKQSYIYFFHSGTRPLAWKTDNNEQINYWFDVANISIGLETEIAKGFSFQVEPFMKLPFKNMGSENLKLNTYGVLLSFRYAPVLSRTKK